MIVLAEACPRRCRYCKTAKPDLPEQKIAHWREVLSNAGELVPNVLPSLDRTGRKPGEKGQVRRYPFCRAGQQDGSRR